ncbi:MAG: leucyl/phenylalanyl-tRNA--protein transferase [Akkermansiaceae bacterium]
MIIAFPDPSEADDDGLLAIGGDLTPETLICAYQQGIFPWSEDPITWWSPDPRGIFDMIRFSPAKRLLRKMRQGLYTFTRDRAFEQVIRACAEPRMDQSGTWLGPKLIEAYMHLHRLGHAHSVECWREGELVGGIYGVTCGGLFAGESMFSRVSDGSKMALSHLIGHLREKGYALFDLQAVNDHTLSLGAIEIPRVEYLRRLRHALTIEARFDAL